MVSEGGVRPRSALRAGPSCGEPRGAELLPTRAGGRPPGQLAPQSRLGQPHARPLPQGGLGVSSPAGPRLGCHEDHPVQGASTSQSRLMRALGSATSQASSSAPAPPTKRPF